MKTHLKAASRANNPTPEQNRLLASLSPAVQLRLIPHLELMKLQLYAFVFESHRPGRHVYFPTDSVVSMQHLLEDGSATAIATVGNEGMIGIQGIISENAVKYPVIVQRAGFAYRLHRSVAKEEFNRHGEFMMLSLRYIQAFTNHVSQTAVCNRHHSILQQFCRWLLTSLDHNSDPCLNMTQEFISNMLGVRREGVSEVATNLQKLGVISYSRGKITVIDRPKLESLACECYHLIRAATDMLLNNLPLQKMPNRHTS